MDACHSPSSHDLRNDRLGMNEALSRRDFLNGALPRGRQSFPPRQSTRNLARRRLQRLRGYSATTATRAATPSPVRETASQSALRRNAATPTRSRQLV